MGAFHAYDIRGVWNVDFDASVAYKVGYFIPSLLKADKVLVGRDCRLSSDEIHDAVIRGITDAGADAVDLGLTSTPMVYFATANYGYKASIQITASHNAPQYNGMKVSRSNALPVGLDTGLGQIKEWIESGRPTPVATARGSVETLDIMDDYLAFMRPYVTDLSGIKIAFDLCNGMSCLFARRIFPENVSYVNDTMDGRFPAHDPNPLIPANVEDLKSLVRRTGADVGVIYDGDADRVMFVDENADFVAPDMVIALMSRYFLGERGFRNPRVLQEIRTSKAVAEHLSRLGCDVHTWRVGRAYAAPRLREIDGLWGGELAGHYYFKEFFYSDSGLLASLIVLRIAAQLKNEGSSLSKAIAGIARYRNSGEINFRITDKAGAMKRICEVFRSEDKVLKEMDFDGFRLEFDRWWFNIRPSNTEPYLRFICEASSDDMLQERIRRTTDILTSEFGAEKA